MDQNQKIMFVLVYNPKENFEGRQFTIRELSEVNPYSTCILLTFDFFALYIPKMWIERFHFLKQSISPPWKQQPVITPDGLYTLDLTEDFYQCFFKTKEDMDYSIFPEVLFYVFQGFSSYLSLKQKQVIRFLLPFLEFLGPEPQEMEHWKKRAQPISASYLLFPDL